MPIPTPPTSSSTLARSHRKPAADTGVACDATGQKVFAKITQQSRPSVTAAQDMVEIASEHCFPASDPPAWIWRAQGI